MNNPSKSAINGENKIARKVPRIMGRELCPQKDCNLIISRSFTAGSMLF